MDQQQLMVKMAVDAWETYIKRTDKLLSSFTDEQLFREIAPGRNRGIYLLGHLAAVHDGIFPLFGLGDRLYPGLENTFVANPDKSGLDMPTVPELRAAWKKVNDQLAGHFNQMSAAVWFQKHNAVSEEDFAKEPHRNKLNLLMNRTSHVAYHLGQMALLNK